MTGGWKAWFAGLALWVLALPYLAATPPDLVDQGRRAVRIYSTEKDGLPIDYVTTQAFDKQGHLWIGTLEGAARYNGSRWEGLRMPRPQRSNWVTTLLPRADGSIWFGTAGDGLHRYQNGRWTSFTPDQGFPGSKVTTLLELPDGDLMVGTQSEGLLRLHPDGRVEPGLPAGQPGRPRLINDLVLQDGTVWAATDQGVFHQEGSGWTRIHQGNSPLPNNLVHCLLPTPDGLWMGTENGLARLQGGRWALFGRELDDPRVLHLSQARDTLWIATWRGLNRFREGRFTPFGKAQGVAFPVIKHLLVEPGTDTLWIGAIGGLMRMTFGGWTTLGLANGPFPDENISALLTVQSPDGTPTHWFGFEGGGLVSWTQGRWQAIPTAAGRNLGVIRGLSAQGEGRDAALWVATAGDGLFQLKGGTWRHFGPEDGLPDKQVYALLVTQDTNGPRVWVGTPKGLGCWDGHTWKKWTTREGLPQDEVNCLIQTPEGDLWVGTRGAGLARFRDGRWSPFGIAQGLEATQILSLSLLPGPGGEPSLWVGTAGGGAWVLNLTQPQPTWAHYSPESTPSLPGGTVYATCQDARGRIYLFTNKGVARFERPAADSGPSSSFVSREFTLEDGLPHLDTNWNSNQVDPSGRIWIGTPHGASILDPATETKPAMPAPLLVDKAYCPDTGQSIFPGQNLPYQRQQVRFEHALLRFFKEPTSRFRTQLVGLDDQPGPWGLDPVTEYQRLPAGSYIHRVWGMDAYGMVSGPIEFAFTLTRPPWATPAARLAYLLFGLLSLYGVVVLRTRMLRQQNLKLQEKVQAATFEILEQKVALEALNQDLQRVNAEKNAFLGIASHDLRNPLNLITLVADGLITGELAQCPVELRPWLEKVQRSGKDMTTLIDRFLNVAAIENGGFNPVLGPTNLGDTLHKSFQAFELRAQKKGITLRVEAAANLVAMADSHFLREILDNLVSNALKFTPTQGQVVLRALREGDFLVVEVQDQGPGFSAEDHLTLFQPFERLSAKPTSGEQSTGLGLAIVRRLVDALGARLELKTAPGEGALFRIFLTPQA